jgi:hypothetical protein
MKTRSILAFVPLLFACQTPAPPDGAFLCGTNNSCPDNYECRSDLRCYKRGSTTTMPDMAMSPSPDLAGSQGFGICSDYCTCELAFCMGAFSDVQSCLSACMALTSTTQSCRNLHCGFAKNYFLMADFNTQETHCTHASGTDPPPQVCP